MADDQDAVGKWIIRRVQDYGLVAGLFVSILTIIFMLLPIYRKQVLMEKSVSDMTASQKEFTDKYIPLIQNTVTSNKVLETKVDIIMQSLNELNRGNRRSSLEKKRPFRAV